MRIPHACHLAVSVLGLALVSAASAQAESITYTVAGLGGLSQPVSGFSDDAFWWASTNGNAPGAALVPYGFDTFAFPSQDGVPSLSDVFAHQVIPGATGSLLLSSTFELQEGDVLAVELSVLASYVPDISFQMGFAVLLENGAIDAMLESFRADTLNHFYGIYGGPTLVFPAPSSGVTTVEQLTQIGGPVTLGGTVFGGPRPPDGATGVCYDGRGCRKDASITYAPGAGSYQLLFGAYQLGDTEPGAVVVRSVTVQHVPEPASGFLLMLGLASVRVARRRLRTRVPQ